MKESTNKTTVVTVTILAVGALLLGITALISNSEEISYPDTFEFRPADHDSGAVVVTSKRVNDGMKLVGIVFRDPEYLVSVAFAVPGDGCFFALDDQEAWPVLAAECAGPEAVLGTLSGRGTTAEGDTYVGVTMMVGEECYRTVELGMDWPPSSPSCA